MLKARALRAVNESSQASMTKIRSVTETGINGLVKSKQNFLIESVGNDESIPDAVGRLSKIICGSFDRTTVRNKRDFTFRWLGKHLQRNRQSLNCFRIFTVRCLLCIIVRNARC